LLPRRLLPPFPSPTLFRSPPVPATPAWMLTKDQAGLSVREKLAAVREKLAAQKAGAMLVTRLDSVAWLLNLRASDIAYNPFALADRKSTRLNSSHVSISYA